MGTPVNILDTGKLLFLGILAARLQIILNPPYNTGHDFVYEDDFAEKTGEYLARSGQFDDQGNRLEYNTESNGRFHTDWLNMMYPRLILARSLLSDEGLIFISIDVNEQHNLRKICDEIFGGSNFLTDFIWNSRKSVSNDAVVSLNHNYTIVYVRNMSAFYEKRSRFKLPDNGEGFENPDNDPRGPWKADPFDSPGIRPNLTYAIKNPNTGEQYWPPEGRCWRTGEQEYMKFLSEGRIVFGKTGTSKPQLKRFLHDAKAKGLTPKSIWDDCGTATDGTKELLDIFKGKVFETPKPTSFIKRILQLSTETDSIILDFFSGSSTTAHAAFELNAEDGGNRRFIMVQIPEKTNEESEAYKAGFKNICEIGKERIRRAGRKIKEEAGMTTSDLDIGFRVLRLDSSNMQDVYYNPGSMTRDLLDETVDNIKIDRSAEDLLFQVMLDLGVDLSSSIEERSINDKKVFIVKPENIDKEYLVACFDKGITSETVTAIAKMQPYYAVFRDNGMASDSVATNFDQIFRTYSPQTERRVL